MKKLFVELTDVDGKRHVSDLSITNDPPETVYQAEQYVKSLDWIKVQNGENLNLDHVKSFTIKEQ